MDVVNPGCHSDDNISVERNGDVMAWVIEKLGAPARIYRMVEHVRCDPLKNGAVRAAEEANRGGHENSNSRVTEWGGTTRRRRRGG